MSIDCSMFMSSQISGSHLSSPVKLSCLPKDFARRLTLEPSVGTSWGFKKNLAPTVPDVNGGFGVSEVSGILPIESKTLVWF